ncbi:TPA: G5 domain-containing protein, partial [Streptococcus suis]
MKRKNSSMFVNKQLFSIRKVHFGAASVIIGALIAFGSGNVVNANTLDGAVVENSANSAQASEVVVENNATEVTGLIADTNSTENATSLASAESIDLTSTEEKTTNYVVDAKITLSDEYIFALEDRNSIMNELKGQKEVDGVLVFNQPKKAAGYKEDAENLQLLENLGKEHLESNTYTASDEDNRRVVDPLNLSESEFEELNVFSTDIANQIRQQIIDKQTRNNQTVTVEKAYVPVGMQNLAFEVTNKAHAIDKERGLSVIVAGDTGGYHGYEYFPWGDKSSGTPERTGIIREAIENNKLDSSQLDLHPEWGQRPASTYTITTLNSTSSSHYDNRISLNEMTMGRMKELIYEGYRTGLFTLASETRPERKWEHALNLTSLETRRLPQYQPNTMISSGLYFIQNRDTWAYNPATGKKEDTKKPVSLTGQYFVNFNFYQDSYSPVVENRINHGESAPGYIDGFDTTLINNIITSKGDQVPPTHYLPVAKIELKEVAFKPIYENDPLLELGKEIVVREGQKGSVRVITIGNQVTEIILIEKVDKLIKRGTLVKEEVKPVEDSAITSKGNQTPPTHSLPEAKIGLKKEVAFETTYENDPLLELGKEIVVREGQNGSVQVITIGDQVTEIVLTEKVDKLVKRGTLVKE